MVDSGARARKIQDEPGIVCSAKEKCSKIMSEVLQRQLEGAPMAITGIFTRAKTYIVIIHKIKIKILRVHTDVTFKNE